MELSRLLSAFRLQLAPPAPATTANTDSPAHGTRWALDHAAIGQACQVASVTPPAAAPEWGRWLAELGFIPGEPAMVTARSPWGDGSVVVRIGSSNFALRRAEAACVSVTGIRRR